MQVKGKKGRLLQNTSRYMEEGRLAAPKRGRCGCRAGVGEEWDPDVPMTKGDQ